MRAIPGSGGGRGSRGDDDDASEGDKLLDREIKRKDKQLILLGKKRSVLEIQRETGEIEGELKRMRKGAPDQPAGEGGAGIQMSPEAIVEISKLPDEQRMAAFQTLAIMKGSGTGDPSNLLLPLVLYGQRTPNAGLKEFLEFSETLTRTAERLNQKSQPAQDTGIVKELLAMIKEQRDKSPPPQKGIYDQIFGDEATYNRMKDLFGSKGADQGTLSNINLELAKMNQQYNLDMRRLDQEGELERERIASEDRRTDAFGGGVKKLMRGVGAAFAAGEAEGDTQRPPEARQAGHPEASKAAGLKQFPCQGCGAPITVRDPKPGDEFKCVKCGAIHGWQPSGDSGDKEEKKP